jgi:hypothetical protein
MTSADKDSGTPLLFAMVPPDRKDNQRPIDEDECTATAEDKHSAVCCQQDKEGGTQKNSATLAHHKGPPSLPMLPRLSANSIHCQ